MRCLIDLDEQLDFGPVKECAALAYNGVNAERETACEPAEKKKIPFIWVLSPRATDIIDAIKKSIFSLDVEEKIFWWVENSRKYFITDKGAVYSLCVYKSDFKAEISEEERECLLYEPYESLAQLEQTRIDYKERGKVFCCWQVRRLDPESGYLKLKVAERKVEHLKECKYKIVKYFNDVTCRYDYYVKIKKDVLVSMVWRGLTAVPVVPNRRNAQEFEIFVDGEHRMFESKKDCYEKVFQGLISFPSFKRYIKKGEFDVNGVHYEVK